MNEDSIHLNEIQDKIDAHLKVKKAAPPTVSKYRCLCRWHGDICQTCAEAELEEES